MSELQTPALEISTDPSRIDLALVHEVLSRTYWADGRGIDVVEKSLRHSLCFGVYHGARQVAFARVITDRAVFAYLSDVFVVQELRGRGIATRLIQAVMDHADLQGLRVFLLRTRDAQPLYAKFGFRALPDVDEMMGRYAG